MSVEEEVTVEKGRLSEEEVCERRAAPAEVAVRPRLEPGLGQREAERFGVFSGNKSGALVLKYAVCVFVLSGPPYILIFLSQSEGRRGQLRPAACLVRGASSARLIGGCPLFLRVTKMLIGGTRVRFRMLIVKAGRNFLADQVVACASGSGHGECHGNKSAVDDRSIWFHVNFSW